MALFQFFKGKVHSVEMFDRDSVPGYDEYETPMDHSFALNDNYHPQNVKNEFITIEVGDEVVVCCVADSKILQIREGSEVDVIFSGKDIVSLLNPKSGYYCFYKTPLYKKITSPKVMNGISMAITAVIVGYIVHLMALHVRSSLFQIITEAMVALCFLGGVVYSVYYHYTEKVMRMEMSKFINRIEGVLNNEDEVS